MDDIQEPGGLTDLRCPACDGRGWRGFHSLGGVETRECLACGGLGVRRVGLTFATPITAGIYDRFDREETSRAISQAEGGAA